MAVVLPGNASVRRLAWAAFALAAGLRLYNADEPHLVHLAVSFGGGSLKPYLFKYPTLWP